MSDSTTDGPRSPHEAPPAAILARDRSASLAWLAFAAAAILAIWLGWSAWREGGVPIEIAFSEGHGIAAGDAVRHRGIAVGTVADVALSPDGGRVIVRAELDRDAAAIAGAATRFWIERPRVGLAGVGGLDTIVGPRYVEMRPGGGDPVRRFEGLDDPPAAESIEPGDLRIVVDASARGSLARGAGVYYRQLRVGTVTSVELAADANSVEAELLVKARYAPLVRARTRFFPVGAVELGLSLEGFRTRIDSLETLLLGGVAFATPPDAGREVPEGTRFVMDAKPEESWLEWRPSILLARVPELEGVAAVPIRVMSKASGLFSRARTRTGWAIPTELGLLAPRTLWDGSVSISAGREGFAIDANGDPASDPALAAAGLSLRPMPAPLAEQVAGVPMGRFRGVREPEDVIVFAPDGTSVPLPQARLASGGAGWLVDPALRLDPRLAGAPIVAIADGTIVGVLSFDGDVASIARIPASFAASGARAGEPLRAEQGSP